MLSLGIAAASAAALTTSGPGNGHVELAALRPVALPTVVVVARRAAPEMLAASAPAASPASGVQLVGHNP
jgi:hypothetical protein